MTNTTVGKFIVFTKQEELTSIKDHPKIQKIIEQTWQPTNNLSTTNEVRVEFSNRLEADALYKLLKETNVIYYSNYMPYVQTV